MRGRRLSQRGTTLAELLVAMALMAVLATTAIALIRPAFSAYRQIRKQEDARLVAQAVLDALRGELLEAQGYLCFASAGEDPALVFEAPGQERQGSALFFGSAAGTAVLLDAGAVPQTLLQAPGESDQLIGPVAVGTLHRREFLRDEAGQWQISGTDGWTAWSCAELLPAQFYGDCTVTLAFSLGTCRQETQPDGAVTDRVQTVVAEVSVWKGEEELAHRTAILPLPKEPCLWDNGNTSAQL